MAVNTSKTPTLETLGIVLQNDPKLAAALSRRLRCKLSARPAQHGLSSDTMALITSDCGDMRSLGSKWP